MQSALNAPHLINEEAAFAYVEAKLWPAIASGAIRPTVFARFPLAEAAEAHRLMESSAHLGKIILTL